MYGLDIVAQPGNQTAKGENKHQPICREKPDVRLNMVVV